MRRLISYLSVALVTFGLGLLVWFASPLTWMKHPRTVPLRVTISPELHPADGKWTSYEYYNVTIENVSNKTVRGYSLGFTCDCFGGLTFSYPHPEKQVLRSGESQTEPVPTDITPNNNRKVWVDLVHFEDGTNWGPNQGHTEGYVKE